MLSGVLYLLMSLMRMGNIGSQIFLLIVIFQSLKKQIGNFVYNNDEDELRRQREEVTSHSSILITVSGKISGGRSSRF